MCFDKNAGTLSPSRLCYFLMFQDNKAGFASLATYQCLLSFVLPRQQTLLYSVQSCQSNNFPLPNDCCFASTYAVMREVLYVLYCSVHSVSAYVSQFIAVLACT